MKSFAELGINVKGLGEQGKTLCPVCSPSRKKKDETCLSVNTKTGQYCCHNCGFKGGTKDDLQRVKFVEKNYVKPKYDLNDTGLSDEVIDYFANRGISTETLVANYVGQKEKNEEIFIALPFIKDSVVNVKYRSISGKKMSLVRDSEVCMYGIQNLFDDGGMVTNKIFITEGEIDSLTLYECGYVYSLSVPNGAGVEEEGHKKITPKLDYLNDPDISEILQKVDQVILVTDSDYKGKRLRDELSQRIGVNKCFSVEYPSGCKDINEVLVKYGRDAVLECILGAQPMLKGLVTVDSLNGEIVAYYSDGLQAGLTCGIEDFDSLYTLKEQLLTLVTGVPEVKKSVFLDNINVGYAREHGLHIAYFSPETKPVEFHIGRLASIYSGKSLNRDSANRMSYEEYKEAVSWVNNHFTFIQPPHASLQEIIELAKLSILKYGTKIIVIDPYSRIRVETEREDKFIRDMLTDLSEFAVRYNVSIFIVAHPTKTETFGRAKEATALKNTPLITPYMIKGAAEWFNSSDFILSLWKDVTIEDAPTLVYCLKSKLYHIAKGNSFVELDYDRKNWRLTSHDRLTNTATM